MRASMIGAVSLAAASWFAPAMAGPQYSGGYYGGYGHGSNTVRCESNDGRVNRCPLPYGNGRVIIERQLSRSACIEGRTWGQERGGIWVAEGCRADFRMGGTGRYYGNDHYYGADGGYYGNPRDQLVRCESTDGRTRRCAAPAYGRAQLVRQLSRSACIEGRTWGSDNGGIWVSQGCRGYFQVVGNYRDRAGYGYGYGNGYGYGYGNAYGEQYGFGRVFRCESNDGRLRECAANTRAGVQLVRQLSRTACIQGRTWGYGRNGIWVSDGCRAEFRSF